jgi:hypothetical protein
MSTLGRKPFRGSVAVASGALTADQLRSNKWRRIFTDVYVDARVPDTQRLRIQAAALRLPADAVVTGRSAAVIWGADLADVGDPVEVISASRLTASGITVRNGAIRSNEIAVRYGVRVPTLIHTCWELARSLVVMDAVPWIDQLARTRRIQTDQLVEHAELHAGEWRCVRAVQTLSLCDWRAESRPESIVRVRLALAGVRRPVPQLEVRVGGTFIARVDLGWEDIKLALEYDGQWHADRDQLSRDRVRIRRLNAAGWYVYPITRDDLRDLDRLVETVRRLIERRSGLL